MTEQETAKIAWVTGAGKGIGRALVKRLVGDGWTVAASARTSKDLESLADECPAGTVHAFTLDVTDPKQTETVVAKIESKLGPVDLAIFNAGTHKPVSIDDFSADDFRLLMETNFMGSVHGLEQIIPKMVARTHGHIAVVASLAGYRGLPTSSAYGASKAALINMCEALKPELDRKGVKLTLINPGFVKTLLTDKNEFTMPFLMSVDDAVDQIMAGLDSNRFEVTFPWRFAWMMKVLRILPDGLFFKLTGRMVEK